GGGGGGGGGRGRERGGGAGGAGGAPEQFPAVVQDRRRAIAVVVEQCPVEAGRRTPFLGIVEPDSRRGRFELEDRFAEQDAPGSRAAPLGKAFGHLDEQLRPRDGSQRQRSGPGDAPAEDVRPEREPQTTSEVGSGIERAVR